MYFLVLKFSENLRLIVDVFFSSVDGNAIKLYQQVVIYIIPMVTTPIFINTFVVFVRLYWFEKRFENIGMRVLVLGNSPSQRSITKPVLSRPYS